MLSTDDAGRAGLTVPRFSEQLRKRITQVISEAGSSTANPIDSAMLAVPSLLSQVIQIAADSGEVDLVLIRLPFAVGGPPFDLATMKSAVRAIFETSHNTGVPLALVMPHGDTAESAGQFMELRRMSLEAGFPLFSTTSRAAQALSIFIEATSRLEHPGGG